MLEKCIVLLILYASLFVFELTKWKQYQKRERLSYLGIMIIAGYLSIIYITELPWPNLDDLINVVFKPPAEQLMNYLRSTS